MKMDSLKKLFKAKTKQKMVMLIKQEQCHMMSCIIGGILDQTGLLDQRVQHSEDCNPNYVEKELSTETVIRFKKW